MRRLALATLLCFGCATTRPPSVESIPHGGPPPARVALAEPELELWMEGTSRPSPEESARSLEQARTALGRALEGRGLEGVDRPDALLVVRERAVARTGERRAAQVASVVGVVAIVAVVIAAILLTRDHPRTHRTQALPAPARGGVLPPAGAWRPRPAPLAPSPFFFGWSVGVHVAVPVRPGPGPGPGPLADVAPPDPLLDPRGWLDADEVELTVELVDPRTGDVRWRRALREGADPRDEKAIAALVDRALAGESFGRRGASPPPPLPPAEAPEGAALPSPGEPERVPGPAPEADL